MSQLHAPTPRALCHKFDTTQDEMPLSRLHDKNLKTRINKNSTETTQLLNYKTAPGKHKWRAYNKALKYLLKEYDPKRKALGCCIQTRSEKQTKYPLRNES